MRGHLEIKLVNPTKVFSRTPLERSVDEFSAQAQVATRAGRAGFLGNVRREATGSEHGTIYGKIPIHR
jgi:hypothetical protein